MNEQRGLLTFAWWNLHNFAHYDVARCGDPRWPTRHADYEAKRDRILAAFQEVFGKEYPAGVVSTPIMRDEDGLPTAFEPGRTRGVSDHLPIVGRLVLSEASS